MDSSSAPSLAEAEIYKKTAVLLVPSIWSEAPASANRPWRVDDMGMSWSVGDPMADIQCYYVMAIEDLPHFQTHPNTPCLNAIMVGYISH